MLQCLRPVPYVNPFQSVQSIDATSGKRRRRLQTNKTEGPGVRRAERGGRLSACGRRHRRGSNPVITFLSFIRTRTISYRRLECWLCLSEFLRLLSTISHSRTVRWFAQLGDDQSSDVDFKFLCGEYFWQTRAAIGHAALGVEVANGETNCFREVIKT